MGIQNGGLRDSDGRYSINETLQKVKAAGGAVVMDKTPIDATSWWAIFTDLDGNEVGLYEGSTGSSES